MTEIIKISEASYESEMPSILSELAYRSKSYWNYPKEWLDSWIPELTIKRADILDNQTFVLKVKNEIAGFAVIVDRLDYLEIDHFWLLPEFIGQGLGSLLMKYLICDLSPLTKPIAALTDPNAEHFYAKHGFEVIEHQSSSIPGRTLPWMVKKIA